MNLMLAKQSIVTIEHMHRSAHNALLRYFRVSHTWKHISKCAWSLILPAVTGSPLGRAQNMHTVVVLKLCCLYAGGSSIFTTHTTVGVLLALAGFCLYSHCKSPMHRRPAAPFIEGVPDLTDPGFRLATSQLGKAWYGRKSAIINQRPTLLL